MERKLERNQQNKMVAGVASGLADYFEMDVTLIRILFICAAVFGFSGILIYIAMWIAVPEKPLFRNSYPFEPDYQTRETPYDTSYKTTEAPFDSMSETTERPYTSYTGAVPPLPNIKKKTDSGRIIAGLCLIAIGAYFMLAELNIIPDWFSIFKLWPVALIVLGVVIITKSGKKKLVDRPPVMNHDKSQDQGSAGADDKPLS